MGTFPWPLTVENGLQARAGYGALKELLSRAFGAPAEEWGTDTEPACLWTVGPLMLDMYCFQRLSSMVMVGPTHAARSAANDVATNQTDRCTQTSDREETVPLYVKSGCPGLRGCLSQGDVEITAFINGPMA